MSLPGLRYGSAADAPRLMDVQRESILVLGRIAYREAEVESWAFGLTPNIYIEAMKHGGEMFLIAEQNGDILGFCSFKPSEIMGLYVRSSASRNGLGSRLLKTAEQALDRDKPVRLRAALSAVAFYKAHGYRSLGKRHWRTRGGVLIEIREMQKGASDA